MELPNRFEAVGEQGMGDDVTLEWVDEGRIAMLGIKRASQEAVDRWFEVGSQLFEEWRTMSR